jgi:hypothetical protein
LKVKKACKDLSDYHREESINLGTNAVTAHNVRPPPASRLVIIIWLVKQKVRSQLLVLVASEVRLDH